VAWTRPQHARPRRHIRRGRYGSHRWHRRHASADRSREWPRPISTTPCIWHRRRSRCPTIFRRANTGGCGRRPRRRASAQEPGRLRVHDRRPAHAHARPSVGVPRTERRRCACTRRSVDRPAGGADSRTTRISRGTPAWRAPSVRFVPACAASLVSGAGALEEPAWPPTTHHRLGDQRSDRAWRGHGDRGQLIVTAMLDPVAPSNGRRPSGPGRAD